MKKIEKGQNPIKMCIQEILNDHRVPLMILTKGADIKGGAIRFFNTYSVYFDDNNEIYADCCNLAEDLVKSGATIKNRSIPGLEDKTSAKFFYSPLNGKLKKVIEKYIGEITEKDDYHDQILADLKEGADGIIINNCCYGD